MNLTEKSVVRTPITSDDIAWALREVERIQKWDGDQYVGYQLSGMIIPRINRLIRERLSQFIQTEINVTILLISKWPEEVLTRGFGIEIELFGQRVGRALFIPQVTPFFTEDSFARRLAHDMIGRAAIERWGR